MAQRLFLLTLLILIFSPVLYSQQSGDANQPERLYESATKNFELGYYGVAREQFYECKTSLSDGVGSLVSDAAFYEAVCAFRLKNNDAAWLLETFISDYTQSTRLSHARFLLGEIAHDENRSKVAIRWYQKVDENSLSRDVRLRYNFKYGYALFENNQYEAAAPYLAKVKDVKSPYWSSANYYYAHILYEKGNHQQALSSFMKIKDEPGFKNIIPYYIAQIYYMEENYDKAIDYGTPLMEEAKGVMRSDLARVLGDSWFAKNDYARSIPYMEVVVAETKKPRREDYFHLGLAYYFTKNYEKAAVNLAQVTSGEDAMTQNAYYHLGDCYLKINDKKNARVAFDAASRYEFDMFIKEESMFNSIKLNYELSFSPFNEIINSLLQFINDFPKSKYIDDAYDYLSQALMVTKNYRQALTTMEKIQHKNDKVYKALQRVSYYRGLELFTNLQFTDALSMFNYSLKYGSYDSKIRLSATYWRGETYYRLNKYQEALTDYSQFLQASESRKLPEYSVAHYNVGYVHFKRKNYDLAGDWFRRFVNIANGDQEKLVGDSYNRIGDSYYMIRDFSNAVSNYNKSIAIKSGAPDYGQYQKALAIGFVSGEQSKITELKKVVDNYPRSRYVDDALYELGRSHVRVGDLDEAIRYFKTVRDKHARSRYANKAMLQLGLVYYNAEQFDNSLVYYKRVVNEYPGTQEAEDALLGIRSIYMDRNDPEGYISFTNQIGGFARVDDRQRDSLSYMTAERLYMSGKPEQAVSRFEEYLKSYPQGRFELNAHYYLADIYYSSKEYDKALKSYEFVTGRGRSMFSEDALLRAAEIHYHKNDFIQSLEFFKRLEEEADLEENRHEALIGQMRALYRSEQPQYTIETAEKVINHPRIAAEIVREAKFYKALSYVALNQYDQALTEFKSLALSTSSKEGAESKYRIAEILFERGNSVGAEEEIFDFINKGTPHQFWLAKSFILLSDVYAQRNEYFQAVQYLESLLENYENSDDGIRNIANTKLVELKKNL